MIPAEPDSGAPAGIRRFVWGFYPIGAIAVLIAVGSTVDRADGRAVPSLTASGVAAILSMAAVRASADGWSTLLRGHARPTELRRSVYASQLGKYVPGGFAQAAGQLAMARRAGISLREAAPRYVLFAGQVAVATLSLGAVTGALVGSLDPGWLWFAGGVLLVAVTTNRAALHGALGLLRRVIRRLDRLAELPDQASMTRGLLFQLGFAAGISASYAVILRSLDHDASLTVAFGAQALAFGVGLLAVPVPSGLLVREAVLVAVLRDTSPAGTVVTAAIFARLVTIAVEIVLILGNQVAAWRTPDAAKEPPS